MSDFKLARLNKWGNFERFTDENGRQEYPTDTVYDHFNNEEIRAAQDQYNKENIYCNTLGWNGKDEFIGDWRGMTIWEKMALNVNN